MSEDETTALVCPVRHVIASSLPYSTPKAFCTECGKPAIDKCPACGASIPDSSPMWGGRWEPDKHCHACGAAYPWTVGAKQAAEDLIDLLDSLKPEDREALKLSLDDLMVDSGRTELVATRFKLIAKRAGSEGAGLVRAVVTSLATDAAKRTILGC